MTKPLRVDQLPEVAVVRDQEGMARNRQGEHLLVRHGGPQIADVGDVMAVGFESPRDEAVDVLVREQDQPVAAVTTRSERSASIG